MLKLNLTVHIYRGSSVLTFLFSLFLLDIVGTGDGDTEECPEKI